MRKRGERVTLPVESVQEMLNNAAQRLAQAGIDSPRLTAEVLLAHTLNISRAHLLTYLDQPLVPLSPGPLVTLSPGQLVTFHSLVARCAAGEPLAYLIGHREFYDLDFICDPRALIPRPETELVVETILHLQPSAPILADIGTGTGCIAVTLARHLPTARVYATDLSANALELARLNAQRNSVGDRITFLQGDLLEPLPEPVHVIAANLPYVTTAEWEALPAHIRLHEPRIALDGGTDGLDLIRRLLTQAPRYLLAGGVIVLEIGASQGPAALQLARAAFPHAQVELRQDYARLDRLIIIKTQAEEKSP